VFQTLGNLAGKVVATEVHATLAERDPNVSYEHSAATACALAFKQVATPADDSEEPAVIARGLR